MRVIDERGQPWIVEPGDPAWPLVKILQAKGYEKIVLTFSLLCGIMRSQPEPAAGSTIGGEAAPTPDSLVRAVRLQDCLEAIKSN